MPYALCVVLSIDLQLNAMVPLAPVDRFFKRLANRAYQTETALKCKTRLLKHRHDLFTFLDFDQVPWNNNNAERASRPLRCFAEISVV